MPFLSFSSPSSSRSASPLEPDMPPQVHNRFNQMEKSIGEVRRAQDKAMDIFEEFAEEQKSIDEKLAMITDYLGLHPMLLREKVERERLATQEQWDAHVPTVVIPAFSLGAPEPDSEDSSGVDSDVPALEDSDVESADVPLRKATRTQTITSERTITLNTRERDGGDDESAEHGDPAIPKLEDVNLPPQESSQVPPIPDKDHERSDGVVRQSTASPVAQSDLPTPQKHISFSDLVTLHDRKNALSTSSLSVHPDASNLSSPGTSPNSSSSNLKRLGGRRTPPGGKRSHSAINLRSLTEGLGHFSLGETDPKRMRRVDAILANEMVFGGFNKERGRSKERR